MEIQYGNWTPSNNGTSVGCGSVFCSCVKDHDHVPYRMQCTIEPVVITIGILLDLVAIAVLTRKPMLSSSSVYLTAMTTSDVLFLLFYSTHFYSTCHHDSLESQAYHLYHKYASEFSIKLFNNSVVGAMCLVMFDRFVAVCHPQNYVAFSTVSLATKLTFSTFLLVVVLTAPELLRIDFDAELDRFGYEWMVDAVFTYFPILFLVICSTRIIICLVHETKRKLRMTRRHGNEVTAARRAANKGYSHLTAMLVVITSAFVVCELPGALLQSYHNYLSFRKVSLTDENIHHYKSAQKICKILSPINTAINFVIYVAMSKKFRETARSSFWPIRWNKSVNVSCPNAKNGNR